VLLPRATAGLEPPTVPRPVTERHSRQPVRDWRPPVLQW